MREWAEYITGVLQRTLDSLALHAQNINRLNDRVRELEARVNKITERHLNEI